MKFTILILLVIALVVFYNKMYTPLQTLTQLQSSPNLLPSPPSILVTLENTPYAIYLQKISHPNLVSLIENFKTKDLSTTLYADNHCLSGVNGGFYTKDDKPLGLFYANGTWLNRQPHTASLFNGYVYKTKTGELKIDTTIPPLDSVNFLFQSGPLFTSASRPSITNDEPARRILLGKTNTDELYFMAITEKNNTNSGPLLTNLPRIIQELNKETMKQFNLFINLDGGSASAFITKDVQLTEFVPVGSFLCESDTN